MGSSADYSSSKGGYGGSSVGGGGHYGQSQPAPVMMMSYGAGSTGGGYSGGPTGNYGESNDGHDGGGSGYSQPQAISMPITMNYGRGNGGGSGYSRMMQPSYGAATHEYALEMLPQTANGIGEQFADSNNQLSTLNNDRMQVNDGQQQVNQDHDPSQAGDLLEESGSRTAGLPLPPFTLNTLGAHFQSQPPTDKRRRRRRRRR